MERELAKQKLQEALEGMTHEEKYDVLTDVLQAEDKVLLGTWFLGEAIIATGAKKAIVVHTKDCTCTLNLQAARGKSIYLGRKV